MELVVANFVSHPVHFLGEEELLVVHLKFTVVESPSTTCTTNTGSVSGRIFSRTHCFLMIVA